MADQVESGDAATSQAPPFSVRILPDEHDDSTPRHHPRPLEELLPASSRRELSSLHKVHGSIDACLDKELDLKRLADVHHWLWLAGTPRPPHALHHQLLMGREIIVTEQMDLHLVWTSGKIFLKPLPRFLLEPDFWDAHLVCAARCCSPNSSGAGEPPPKRYSERCLRRSALGFLYSYVALLAYETDFHIALGKHLIPPAARWTAWRTLVEQLDIENIHRVIDRRFIHGELRLSRLNKIYWLLKTPLRGYMPRWYRYGDFLHDKFAWLAGTAVYIAMMMNAMQLGFRTEPLARSPAFKSAAYGFAIFALLGPLIATSFIMLQLFGLFVYNWIMAVRTRNKRYSELNHV